VDEIEVQDHLMQSLVCFYCLIFWMKNLKQNFLHLQSI